MESLPSLNFHDVKAHASLKSGKRSWPRGKSSHSTYHDNMSSGSLYLSST